MNDMTTTQPHWLDRKHFPFESRFFEHDDGRLHYIDEGEGDVLLFVHGTPTWSFLYRHLICHLRDRSRCVAVDHLGFGLSEKPREAPYHPRDHAARLGKLVDHLDLTDVTLTSGNDYGAVMVVALDDQPLRESRRILIQVGTTARPTGWKQRPAATDSGDRNEAVMEIVDHGGPPWLLEEVDASLTVANEHVSEAIVLDPNGYPQETIPLDRDGSEISLRLPAAAKYVVLR